MKLNDGCYRHILEIYEYHVYELAKDMSIDIDIYLKISQSCIVTSRISSIYLFEIVPVRLCMEPMTR